MKQKCPLLFFLVVLPVLPLFFSACDQTVGFGQAIDWEPPVLTLDPGPNPRYVNSDTVISGTCTDNVAVVSVICRDANNPERILGNAAISGDRWSMTLNFTEADNTNRLTVEFVAYDRAGNSGESSTKTLTVIVDLHPPLYERVDIWRSGLKTTALKRLEDLQELETIDPDAVIYNYLNNYQNGTFWIRAELAEEETSVKNVVLYLYDSENDSPEPGNEVYSSLYPGSSKQSPQWTIKEHEIVNTPLGKQLNYQSRLDAGQRIYLRVSITAEDMGVNKGTWHEDFGYFCLYRDADRPKAVISSRVGLFLSPGTEIPVDIFDDDEIAEAYVDLLTVAQFNSYTGDTNEEKLKSILAALEAGETVWNWRNQGKTPHMDTGENAKVKKQTGMSVDYKTVTVKAGVNDADHGEYKVIVILRDAKSPPHEQGDDTTMYHPVWGFYEFDISVTDNNVPVIVIDTVDTHDATYVPGDGKHLGWEDPVTGIEEAGTGNSPEENTFPALEDGRYFSINGYTLDDNTNERGRIDIFRIAWIPFAIGQETNLEAVKTAMQYEGTPYAPQFPYPGGVQHWTISDHTDTSKKSYYIDGSPQIINGVEYTKQTFKKRFDILGEEPDDLVPEYRNFHYNGILENEPKLFVLYARDIDGHDIHRTIRLLGNNTPPGIKVYDFTTKSGLSGLTAPSDPADKDQQEALYAAISGQPFSDADIMGPFKTYPRNTTLKMYVKAEDAGEIQLKELRMYDVTYDNPGPDTEKGFFDADYRDLTYSMSLPDVEQRVFLFEAENMLGTKVQLQRTVATTTTAYLEEIITPSPSGSYGRGEKILLQAHFSGLAWVIFNGTAKPELNVRYEVNSSASTTFPTSPSDVAGKKWVYEAVPYSGLERYPSMYLDFEFTVPADANGRLQTIDSSNGLGTINKPIDLYGTQIQDAERQVTVFLPGDASYENWKDGENSLQSSKDIIVDGILPVITGFMAGGKAPYESTDNVLYFKSGETIEFSLQASKQIRTSGDGNPRIQLQLIDRVDGHKLPTDQNPTNFYADFSRPAGQNGMVFTIDTDDIDFTGANNSAESGTLVIAGINFEQGEIKDMVGNDLNSSALSSHYNDTDNAVRIDKRVPSDTSPSFDGKPLDPAIINRFTVNPVMTMQVDGSNLEPWGAIAQYSLDGGLKWEDYHGGVTIDTGTYALRTRQKDKAGNESALSPIYNLEINGVFPALMSITAREPEGIYTKGPITINLDFAAPVKTTLDADDANRACIIVSDINHAGTTVDDGEDGIPQTAKIYAERQTEDKKLTLSFIWDPILYKQMPNGITVREIHLQGDVLDIYGNAGVNSAAVTLAQVTMNVSNSGASTYLVDNLNGAGIKVYTIPPKMVKTVPANAQGNTANSPSYILTDRSTITMFFNSNMRKETGTVYIKPHGDSGNFPIPPVFPAEGYYREDGTYVDSFYDVYSSALLNDTDRGYLLSGTYANPTLNSRTGLYEGPYKLTTQGLKPGRGYKADNPTSGAGATPDAMSEDTGWNAVWNGDDEDPDDPDHFMVPDISAKYVLDYQYAINDTTTAVTNIRRTLHKARYRWREIDVLSANIKLTAATEVELEGTGANWLGAANTQKITIILDPPLPEGFAWDLYFTQGTFTDVAGIEALELPDWEPGQAAPEGAFWFWTDGVQAPVIRVDRRSIDYRTNAVINDANKYSAKNALDYGTPPAAYGIGGMNSVAFRAESETPGASVTFHTLRGVRGAGGTGELANAAVDGAFAANANGVAWRTFATGTNTGTWVLPNLVRRSISGRWSGTTPQTGFSYVALENGVPVTYTSVGSLRMFRSYNRDATRGELDDRIEQAGAVTATSGTLSLVNFSNTVYQASKNYVVANAGITHPGSTAQTSVNGYEGIFMTVIALDAPNRDGGNNPKFFSGANGDAPVQFMASNSMSPTPSVPGFPTMLLSADMRYLKLPYGGNGSTWYYWLSTEIVSPLFAGFASIQNNAGATSRPFNLAGEAGALLTGGYGDLTQSYGQDLKTW